MFVVEDVTLIFTCVGINTKHVATCTKISAPPCKLLKYYILGIDGASGVLTGKVIDLTKKKYTVTPSFTEKYRWWYNCNIVPPKGKMVLNKNRNPTISKRYVGSSHTS